MLKIFQLHMEVTGSRALYILQEISFFRDLFNLFNSSRYEKEVTYEVTYELRPHLCFSQNYTYIVLNREYIATNCRRISTSFHNCVHSSRNSTCVIFFEIYLVSISTVSCRATHFAL